MLQQSLRPYTTTSLTTDCCGRVTTSQGSCWLSCDMQMFRSSPWLAVRPSMHMAGW